MSAFVAVGGAGSHFLASAGRQVLGCPPRLPRVSRTRLRDGSTVARRARCPTARTPFDDPPPEVQELNRLEAERRAEADARTEKPPRLTDGDLEKLFKLSPVLRDIDAYLDSALQSTPGLDPDSTEPFTWAWRNWMPWYPSYFLIACASFACCTLLKRFITVVRIRCFPAEIALALVRVDFVATLALAGILATALLIFSLLKESDHSDAQKRLSIMFSLTSVMLPAASALASCGFENPAFLLGSIARLVFLPMTMWMWRDLSQEVFVMRAFYNKPVAYIFAAWRWLTTFLVCLYGGILRAIAYANLRDLAIRQLFLSRALGLRLRIFMRFPVAMSLFGDPGGLGLLAALFLTFAICYAFYVVVFVTDYLKNRMHRETTSVFTRMMISNGIYMPNVLRNRESLLSTAPPGEPPYFPSPAMLLREAPSLLGANQIYVENGVPPILEFLEDEQTMMEKKGMPRWNPPRTEFVPLTEHMTYGRRSREALASWARPLQDPASQSFADFFESVEDEEEFVYDPRTENWVFSESSRHFKAPEDETIDAHAEDVEAKQRAGEQQADSGDSNSQPVDGEVREEPVVETKYPDLRNPDLGTVV